jgi:hypothetical protein
MGLAISKAKLQLPAFNNLNKQHFSISRIRNEEEKENKKDVEKQVEIEKQDEIKIVKEEDIESDKENNNIEDEEEITIYVLECMDGKYYVGRTGNLDKRLELHSSGRGSFWTRKYPMKSVIEVLKNADKFDEDKYVLKYMDKYGVENVRGGSYSQMVLNNDLQKCIQRHFITANNLCYICGGQGHLIRECKDNPKNARLLNNLEERRKFSEEPPRKKIKVEDISFSFDSEALCNRCGRTGHYAEQCFSKKHFNGEKL